MGNAFKYMNERYFQVKNNGKCLPPRDPSLCIKFEQIFIRKKGVFPGKMSGQ